MSMRTSEASEKGVMPGDVIVEAGQQKVLSIKDLQDRLSEAKATGRKSILLLVRREGDPRFVALSSSKVRTTRDWGRRGNLPPFCVLRCTAKGDFCCAAGPSRPRR